ncbi:uncharacterized protein EDB93DRAFT_224548 [Suillus bovinus]|uniref:uncharacterized protein n=1 Tax=Suillus bovinus TaxID=48563 RepID=UPI001B87DADA|nr:uncharacterized protein EDB93DRAFT_224548 [Suillus bovinus]KAG2153569.1 hypothetical protein EDB93DRAFT_224548 [Suillus bovinus]
MALRIVRWCVLVLTLMFAIVVLGISAHLIAIRPTDYWRFAALAVAVSSLTILTLPVILIVNSFSGGSSPERVMGEALWIAILWILWLSTGANSTRAARSTFFSGACSFFTGYPNKICNEFKVVEGFSYMIFIILLCYMIGLMVCAFMRDDDHDGRAPQTSQVKAADPEATSR